MNNKIALQETRRDRPIAISISIQAGHWSPAARGVLLGSAARALAAPHHQPAGRAGGRPPRHADVPALQDQHEPAEYLQEENVAT